LLQKQEKLEIELREKIDQAKLTENRRENIGITLYQHQQQLARLQAILDNAQENYDKERCIREALESKVKLMADKHKDVNGKLRERESQCTTGN
jgi:hypothetical protein